MAKTTFNVLLGLVAGALAMVVLVIAWFTVERPVDARLTE